METRGQDYAPPRLRLRHSFYSVASLVTAAVVVCWHLYLIRVSGAPPIFPSGNVQFIVAYDYRWLPSLIGVGLGILGILQTGRKRVLSFIAIAVISVTYVLLAPPMNWT